MHFEIIANNLFKSINEIIYYKLGWFKHSIKGVNIKNDSKISPFCSIAPGCTVSGTFIAKNVTIGHGTYINTGEIQATCIGRYVSIGPKVLIGLNEHNLDYWTLSPVEAKEHGIKGTPTDKEKQQVIINDGCWIGAGCIILQGVTVGSGAVVGAGSVVTKNIPEMEIWAGVPAKKIKSRIIRKHKSQT